VSRATGDGDEIRGADAATVRRARETGGALPGTAGFAGALDGALVRDVLGRELVYADAADPGRWAFDPDRLDEPALVPAGHARPLAADPADEGTAAAAERVWMLPDPSPARDRGAAVRTVRAAVAAGVEATVGPDAADRPIALAFSGGLDSAALAARTTGPLYAAGFPGSHDLAAAREAAAALGRREALRVLELSHADLERAIPTVARATGRTNPMDVSIAVPLFLVAERAAADGHDRLVVGQGADELFGGYAKVAGAPDDPRVEADTVRGARRETVLGLPEGLERDLRAIRAAGVEPVLPFCHDRVVRAALELPADLLVAGGRRKVALRRACVDLPDAIRERDKKALQYGTYVSREIDRLARRAGFKRRMDDHVRRYVESLL